MAGHRPFRELTQDWSPERRQRVKEAANSLLREMRLHERRRARELSQRDKAEEPAARPLPSPMNQTQPPGQ